MRWLYDKNNKLYKEISPYGYDAEADDGAGTTYAYDSRGNRIRVTNAFGEVVKELSYNLQDQPAVQRDASGTTTEFAYEMDGQVRDVRRRNGRNHGDRRTLQQYEYNAGGQLYGIVDGNQNKVSYDTDSWGRITSISFADGVEEGCEYTPSGQVSRTTDGNGSQ